MRIHIYIYVCIHKHIHIFIWPPPNCSQGTVFRGNLRIDAAELYENIQTRLKGAYALDGAQLLLILDPLPLSLQQMQVYIYIHIHTYIFMYRPTPTHDCRSINLAMGCEARELLSAAALDSRPAPAHSRCRFPYTYMHIHTCIEIHLYTTMVV